MRRILLSMIATFLLAAPALADGDAAKGEKVFGKCKACHDVASDKNKVGPTLHGVIGRKAGAVEGFKYSEAMTSSGITWDVTTLTAYLKDPKGYVPGNKMAFTGLKKDEDVVDVIAYIQEASAK
jgi:cytochrome c